MTRSGRWALGKALWCGLALSACTAPADPAGTHARPADLAPTPPVSCDGDGREAIYAFLSAGSIKIANEALDDVWDLGPRSSPVSLAPITWSEDPHDKYWRFLFYGLRPLSNLLHAYCTTSDVRYRDKLLEVLRSFTAFDASLAGAPNAFLDDLHTSAFRQMMLVNLFGKLQRTGDLPADLAAAMRASIARLGAFLTVPEHFQDGENHGFTEAAALLVAAVNFPDLPDAPAWRTLALDRLTGLMTSTIDADGVEVENSPFYHFYVLTFMQQDSDWMQAHGVTPPAGFDALIARMFDYATYCVQPDGFAPLLGSSVLLNVHQLLPDLYDADSLDDHPSLDQQTEAFTFVRSLGSEGTPPPLRNVRFPVSGQSFLRTGFGDAATFTQQSWLSFNAGNYRSRHNHLDALGITYYSGGKPLVIDSGLYEYQSVKATDPFIDYFSSTRAHNTVTVDDGDQDDDSSVGGPVRGGLVSTADPWAYQSAAHGRYPGVEHRRSVVLLSRDVVLLVDALDGDDVHGYAQSFHLEPTARIDESGPAPALDPLVALDSNGVPELAIHQHDGAALMRSTLRAQMSPVQGYFSTVYGEFHQDAVVEYRMTAASARLATLVVSGHRAALPARVAAVFDATGPRDAHVTVCSDDLAVEVDIHAQASDGEAVAVTASVSCP